MATLTEEQENFCQAYVTNGRKPMAAYRTAYNTDSMMMQSVRRNARIVRNTEAVIRRIAELDNTI